tara:strand:+ start:85 stop:819 length:735 start_codon:yes stop_codon:yes gene_type:complete
MDCQKLIVYGILILVGIYVLKDVCGVKLPFIEGFTVEGAENGPVGANDPGGAPLLGGNTNGNVANAANNLPNPNTANNNSVPEPFANANGPVVPQGNTAPPAEAGSPSDVKPGNWGAAEPSGNEFNMPIEGIKTAPANCYPQNTLSPQDLLPEGEGSQIQDFNEGLPDTGEGILKGVNFLDAGFHVGVNTVGQSLRNANLNLRAEPPNPRSQVSPWMNSTIDIDLARKPLADGDCNVLPGQIPA